MPGTRVRDPLVVGRPVRAAPMASGPGGTGLVAAVR